MQEKSIHKVRNFGFIAHIDAGKTTTTERVLYISGKNRRIGEVDEGTATTDWMEEEKERGITITAASVYLEWKQHHLHLIDTPGHVDFSIEVERSLKVLDGAVLILCGVAGIQTQTETVFRQAAGAGIPLIFYINKLDRQGADFQNVFQQIRSQFNIRTVLLSLPVYEGGVLTGTVDLVRFKKIAYGLRGEIVSETAPDDPLSHEYRDMLIDCVTDFNPDLVEQALSGTIPEETIISVVRQAVLTRSWYPVLCGASQKNIGVQSLLDAVTAFLPSPDVRNNLKVMTLPDNIHIPLEKLKGVLAYIFKIQHHKEMGFLYFVRIYKGSISVHDHLINSRTKKAEKVHNLYRVFADQFDRIESAGEGDIVMIQGIKNSINGDTLCDENHLYRMENDQFPEPVLFIRVEPENLSELEKYHLALDQYLLEDPTIRSIEDPETGQILIGGQGELHLEVFLHRIRREFHIDLKQGKPVVAHRETPLKPEEIHYRFDNRIGPLIHQCEVTLSCRPLERNSGVVINLDYARKILNEEEFSIASEVISQSLISGPEGAYPVTDIEITLTGLVYERKNSSLIALESALGSSVHQLLKTAGCQLLTPVMNLMIETPSVYTGTLIGDIQSRGGNVVDVSQKNHLDKIEARCPLEKLFGYSTSIRSMTQGKATFSMTFREFDIS